MKANELRIGNLTLCGDEYYRIDSESFEMNGWIESTLKPIPLTPEILERCGFEGNNFKRRYKSVGETSLTIYFENNILSIQDYDWFRQNLDNIKHLHQLQNLYFALTGQELQVNL